MSPVISKVFENYVLEEFSDFFGVDHLQFGFQKGVGCNSAIFALRQVIEYFNNRGSNVYVASLDATKAFDRVNHYQMFAILFRANLPGFLIKTLINWYSKLAASVKWNNSMSGTFRICSGVRQGGILSPALFNIYVNCIIIKLRSSALGCHISNIYLGVIMYADDILLLSSSCIELQKMLNACSDLGDILGIRFNSKKSKCIIIGPNKPSKLPDMYIDNDLLQWCDKIKYLGIFIKSDAGFRVDYSEARRKYFSALNSIVYNSKFCTEIVIFELVEKQCMPLLLYCIESLDLSKKDISSVNSWLNMALRKVFGYNKWESDN